MPEAMLATRLSDEELGKICATKAFDSPEWEEYAKRCMKQLGQIFGSYVHKQNFCPPGIDHADFVADCVNEFMQRKLEALLKTLQTNPPKRFSTFLWAAGYRFLVDECEWFKRHWPPSATPPPAKVDEEEEEQELESVYPESDFWTDPSVTVQQREYREIIDKLLAIHAATGSKRDKECCLWIGEFFNTGDVGTIAERRDSTEDDVYHLFGEDYKALRKIREEHFPNLHYEDLGIWKIRARKGKSKSLATPMGT